MTKISFDIAKTEQFDVVVCGGGCAGVVAAVAAVYFLIGPGKTTDTGATIGTDAAGNTVSGCSFTVEVIHADGSAKTFSYTAEGKLGAFLETEGLISSEGADPGMFHTVDGEKADWNENQSYWAFYLGEDYAMSGIYDTDIEDGETYKLVYTIG